MILHEIWSLIGLYKMQIGSSALKVKQFCTYLYTLVLYASQTCSDTLFDNPLTLYYLPF